ncbi:MAG: hypothetical protein HW412_2188 [Bacteroidetes bacterium]|nr:hypothetical protein [Bacteroidota bacterium]
MVAEEIEVVLFGNVDENSLDPVGIPGERTPICIREKAMECNVATAEKRLLAIKKEVTPNDFEFPHAECCSHRISRFVVHSDGCIKLIEEWVLDRPKMHIVHRETEGNGDFLVSAERMPARHLRGNHSFRLPFKQRSIDLQYAVPLCSPQ